MSSDRTDWAALSAYPGPHQSPGFRVWRDFMRWQRQLNALLKTYELTQPQFAVLATCAWLTRDGGEITQQGIVDFLDMDRMHISQIASRLERDGLLERRTSEKDMRSKIVALTPAGADKIGRALPVVEKFDQEFFAAAVPTPARK